MAELRRDPAPGGDGPRWRLAELVPLETLQSIQDTFARAFGLPTVIVDPDGEPATQFTNRLAFCEDLTRSTRLGGDRCASCQGAARAEALATGAPAIYRCWNGLYDAAIPIAPKGEVVGYFLCGQVFDAPPDADHYRAVAAELGADPEAYAAGIADVRVVPREQHEASVRSMHVLARLIGEQAAAAIDNLAMLEQAREAERNAASHVEELRVVLDSVRDLSRPTEPRRTLEALGDAVLGLLACDACVLYRCGADGRPADEPVVRPGGAATARRVSAFESEAAAAAAASGEPARFVDWARSRHGVAAPLLHAGRCVGALVASRPGRAFSERELEMASVLNRQAAASLELARLALAAEAGARREGVLAGFAAAAADGDARAVAERAARAALELLGAEGAIVFVGEEAAASVGLGAEVTPLLEAVRQSRRAGSEGPPFSPSADATVLVVSLAGGAEPVDLVLAGRAGRGWDHATAGAIAASAASAFEHVRARERLERAARREDRLVELMARLAEAADMEDVQRALLEGTAALVGADVAAVALIGDEQPGDARIRIADAAGLVETAITLAGPPRIAAVRLRGGRQPRAVFDAWAAEALAALSSVAGTEQHLAEPLHGRSGTRGAVLCGWRADASRARVDAGRRRLKLVANAAAGALARFVAADRTHAELRARVDELEAIAKLATRLAGAGDEGSVLAALLETASEAGRIDGAFFAARSGDGWEVRRVAGLGEAAVAEGLRAAAGLTGGETVVRVESDVGAETVAVATVERTALLVGRRSIRDPRRDRVLARLLADAAAALARIDAERGRTETIARLERERAGAAARLERAARAVAARDALALAALEGLEPLAAALAGAIGGTAAVTDPDGRELVRSGEAAGPSAWRPPRGGGPPRPVTQRRSGRRTVAAPALLGGEPLAWVVSEDATEDAATVRAAVEHAAVLAASHRLRERTALEVELRIRGGFVDDVCARRAPDEQLLAQGRTLGLDLTAPSRVLLVEPAEDDALAGAALHDAVAESVREWPAGAVAASRGRGVAVIFAEDGELAFEECLRRTLDARVPGVSLAIAVGTECSAVADYARSDDAARRALDLMRAAGDRGRTFSFRDESFETLLLQASDPAALLRFVERHVGPIDRADRGRSTELRRTLETYFACGRNLEQTARRLHVHVSTLRYRLARACVLAGVEPKDERALRDLQLALAVAATLPGAAPRART